jgi:hypothetical protein
VIQSKKVQVGGYSWQQEVASNKNELASAGKRSEQRKTENTDGDGRDERGTRKGRRREGRGRGNRKEVGFFSTNNFTGTFRVALFNRLSNTLTRLFMHLLCLIDRNNNLGLYWKSLSPNSANVKNLWLRIFQDPSLFSLKFIEDSMAVASVGDHHRYDVHSDGASGIFNSHFPFSFIFCHAGTNFVFRIFSVRDFFGSLTCNS